MHSPAFCVSSMESQTNWHGIFKKIGRLSHCCRLATEGDTDAHLTRKIKHLPSSGWRKRCRLEDQGLKVIWGGEKDLGAGRGHEYAVRLSLVRHQPPLTLLRALYWSCIWVYGAPACSLYFFDWTYPSFLPLFPSFYLDFDAKLPHKSKDNS